jgi:maltose O-acetyltransferase
MSDPGTDTGWEQFRVAHSVNRRWWHLAVNVIGGSQMVSPRVRSRIYRRCKIAAETEQILPGCFFYGHDISIGAATWVNHRCYFDTRAPITIGRNCDLAMEVMFCTSDHELGPHSRRAGDYRAAPIRVGDGTWIGTRALLLPGVTVGAGCVIAAGSVVTGDCEPDGLYAGAPARRIKDLET